MKALSRDKEATDTLMRSFRVVVLNPLFKAAKCLLKTVEMMMIEQFRLDPFVQRLNLA